MLIVMFLLPMFFLLSLSQNGAETPQQLSYMGPGLGGNGDCFRKFPRLKNRFSWEQLEFFCQQIRAYNDIIYGNATKKADFTAEQQKYLDSLKIDLNFTKENGGSIRKEIRLLSNRERRLLDLALRSIKNEKIDGISKYDLIVLLSHPAFAPGAHVGAAFLPWHREYLRTFETALRKEHNLVIGLPYWDSTLDSSLPDPTGSIVWHPRFFGNPHGPVMVGPFAGKAFRQPDKDEPVILTRNIGQNGSLLTPEDVEFVLSRLQYKELTACVDLRFEQMNRNVYKWVGGSMADNYYASQDFVFFIHHAFADYLWHQFRAKTTENRYPTKYEACTKFHEARSLLRPFEPLTNYKAFVSNEVYYQYYTYESVPTCSEGCGKWLFCHLEQGRCLSRIRSGGNCSGLQEYDSCYNSRCLEGVCQVIHSVKDKQDKKDEGSGEGEVGMEGSGEDSDKNDGDKIETLLEGSGEDGIENIEKGDEDSDSSKEDGKGNGEDIWINKKEENNMDENGKIIGEEVGKSALEKAQNDDGKQSEKEDGKDEQGSDTDKDKEGNRKDNQEQSGHSKEDRGDYRESNREIDDKDIGEEGGKHTEKELRKMNSEEEHGKVSEDENGEDNEEELGKDNLEGHGKDNGEEHGKDSGDGEEHGKDVEGEHGKDSEEELGKDNLEGHGKDNGEEHGKDSGEEHGKDNEEEHGKDNGEEHGKDNEEEHGKDNGEEHGKENQQEHGAKNEEEHMKPNQEEHVDENEAEHVDENEEEHGKANGEDDGKGKEEAAVKDNSEKHVKESKEINEPKSDVKDNVGDDRIENLKGTDMEGSKKEEKVEKLHFSVNEPLNQLDLE